MASQPPLRRVLFVCSQNLMRSPTAELVFGQTPGLACASAGVNATAVNPLTGELVAWAEIIFVMEAAHRDQLVARYPRQLGDKPVICLDIPDRYRYLDPALVRLLKAKVTPHLPRA